MRFIQIIVVGKVQGVFFRRFTREKARQLQLKGFVCNRHDGSVYIEAGGHTEKIQQFIDWCNQGPEAAEVVNVTVNNIEPQDFKEFDIRNTR